ncbi:MAG: hypothetical protein ACE5H0_12160 [Bacteroidota bacterium]
MISSDGLQEGQTRFVQLIRRLKWAVLIFVPASLLSEASRAQGCCTAGTPILGTLELGSSPPNTLQFNVTYEYTFRDRFYLGNDRVDDPTVYGQARRDQAIHSVLLETAYGLSRRVSVSSVLSFTRRGLDRTSSAPGGGVTTSLNNSGLSDGVFLVKYSIVPLGLISQREVALGGGVKVPLGSYDKTQLNRVVFPFDMQQGTGSWDGILWGYFYQGFLPTRVHLFANALHRFTGTNRVGYKFGNEIFATVGVSYRTPRYLDFSLQGRYRHLQADELGGAPLLNTGGDWLYLVPTVNVNPANDVSVRLFSQLPVYQSVTGIQLTTTYTLGLGVAYNVRL